MCVAVAVFAVYVVCVVCTFCVDVRRACDMSFVCVVADMRLQSPEVDVCERSATREVRNYFELILDAGDSRPSVESVREI